MLQLLGTLEPSPTWVPRPGSDKKIDSLHLKSRTRLALNFRCVAGVAETATSAAGQRRQRRSRRVAATRPTGRSAALESPFARPPLRTAAAATSRAAAATVVAAGAAGGGDGGGGSGWRRQRRRRVPPADEHDAGMGSTTSVARSVGVAGRSTVAAADGQVAAGSTTERRGSRIFSREPRRGVTTDGAILWGGGGGGRAI